MTTVEIINAIGQVSTNDEMKEIAKAVNRQCSYLDQQAISQFRVKDEVEWDSKLGKESGRIERINSKTMTIKHHDGDTWRVSASMLRPA